MNKLGLSHAELRKFHAALEESHTIRVQVDVLNLNQETLYPLDARIIDGQVDVSLDSTPTRSLTISFKDPEKRIRLDVTRMLRVWYGVHVEDVGWVDCPVFTGPITKLDWSEGIASAEAHGKEHFHIQPAFKPFTVKKRTKKVDGIRKILERGGETKFDLPDLDAKMPQSMSVGGQDDRWKKALKIARSTSRQLFYDGRGIATLRNRPGDPVFIFRDGNHTVLTEPQVTKSLDRVKNAVRIKGGFPKGYKKEREEAEKKIRESDRVRFSATAPRSHPLSPWSLGLEDGPLYLPEFIDNDHVRSKKEAEKLAEDTLDEGLRAETTVTFDALPVPHLEEGDLVKVATKDTSETFRLSEFSIPLAHGGVMSVGYRKLVSNPGRRNVK